ncbi:hypothetical protein JYT36_00825 [Bacteroidales bacterium AH-315-N07]|nr:hypothetical protein [Bacteroidales bacterium AH-315-N07]
MELKVIKTKRDLKNAILMHEKMSENLNKKKTLEQYELLGALIELYELKNNPLPQGDPIEIIKLMMEMKGLKQKDMVGKVASKGTLSDVLNKKRWLSKSMIRKFAEILGIPQESLNVPYELDIDVSGKVVGTKAIKRGLV